MSTASLSDDLTSPSPSPSPPPVPAPRKSGRPWKNPKKGAGAPMFTTFEDSYHPERRESLPTLHSESRVRHSPYPMRQAYAPSSLSSYTFPPTAEEGSDKSGWPRLSTDLLSFDDPVASAYPFSSTGFGSPMTASSDYQRSAQTHIQSPTTMPSVTATVPCQYRTGKTLGSGTYAIVKEAIHIKTGKYYACKVINKKLMQGREHMVRNEIAVLRRISSGNPNIVTLHDYFETSHNLYLCFDLCTGGELFDRICAKGNYYEADAADLVRTIFAAVKYIHAAGIVHHDLKPENLLFRTPAEEADIMIADFGLSRIMEEEKLSMLTEICGTPGYMAPEIFLKTGHSKPVDVWAMGVVTYFLLAGYTPFDRDTPQLEMEAIIAGDYKFEPAEYWMNVSPTARDFVKVCLTIDPERRPTAQEALAHKVRFFLSSFPNTLALRTPHAHTHADDTPQWLTSTTPHFVPDPEGEPRDLLPHVKKAFNAKLTWRKAAFSIKALNRMTAMAGYLSTDAQALSEDVKRFKEESAAERMEDASIVYQHPSSGHGGSGFSGAPRGSANVTAKLEMASLEDSETAKSPTIGGFPSSLVPSRSESTSVDPLRDTPSIKSLTTDLTTLVQPGPPAYSIYSSDQEMWTPLVNNTTHNVPLPQLQPGGSPIATFVIYTPKDLESPLDLPTGTTAALRQEDVDVLENEFPNGGILSSVHSPDEAVLWVETHYTDPLLESIRSHGIGGPIASMLSPDIPALVIFGSFLEKSVVQAAQLLANGSRLMVMLRPAIDCPVPKWEGNAGNDIQSQHVNQEDINQCHLAEHEETHGSDNSSIASTEEVEEMDSGTSGVLRLRGGAEEDEYSPRLSPIHNIEIDITLCPDVGVAHRLRLVSDTQFKVQTRHTDTRRNGNRLQIISWTQFSVVLGSAGMFMDRSYSSCGFLVHRGHKISKCVSIPCAQFTPPNQTTKVTSTNTSQNTTTATLTMGVNPTGALAFAENNISANAVEQTNDRVTPKCPVHSSQGNWWSERDENDVTMQSFDSINFAYEALATFEDNIKQHPMEVEYSIGINTNNTTSVQASEFPDLTSFITRNQTLLWIPDENLRAKGRGIIIHTSSFIPDIETNETILVDERITTKLSSPPLTKPPGTAKKSKYDIALSVSIGVMDRTDPEDKPRFFKKMKGTLSGSSRRKNKPKPHPLPVILHEHVSRGWDETTRDWRLPIYPTLDRYFQHNRDPSEDFWKLEVTDENGAMLVDDEYEGPRTIPVKGPRVHSTSQALGVGGSSNLGTMTVFHSSFITGESSAGSGTGSTGATSIEVPVDAATLEARPSELKGKGKAPEISQVPASESE
ncbi:hypothetical protein C8J57DRAFT_1726395 [Mycena rebaudengoi]|nr:hypothetical protein C8J57DRAFT_1726395 [Mycena rebaudengoi]